MGKIRAAALWIVAGAGAVPMGHVRAEPGLEMAADVEQAALSQKQIRCRLRVCRS